MDLIPLDDRIIAEKLKPENITKGGVILPTLDEQTDRGKIIAIGEKSVLKLKIGDIILFSPHAGIKYQYGGKEYMILKEDGISARLKRKNE